MSEVNMTLNDVPTITQTFPNLTLNVGSAVDSVNGKTGTVVLDGGDINVDESAATKTTIKNAIANLITSITAKYTKPASGIPKTDMASDVQTSLGKADTALQEHQSLSAYRTSADQDEIDETKVPTSRTVNNKALSEDIEIEAQDIFFDCDIRAKLQATDVQSAIDELTDTTDSQSSQIVALQNLGLTVVDGKINITYTEE